MDESYRALAPWLNVEADEIYFGPSTSQNTYVLANAAIGWLQPGDEIIVTNQDHEANSGAWRRLADRGMVVREWKVDPATGQLDLKQLPELISAKTRLLTFPHCSNILGEINPVQEICSIAKAHDVRTVVDGVSFAGHGLPDIKVLGADVYLFSLYKVYGPHLGVMVMNREVASLFKNQAHFFLEPIREKRFYPAGPDHAQVAAAKGVSDYFDAVYEHHLKSSEHNGETRAESLRQLLHASEQRVMARLLEYFNQKSSIRLLGPDRAEDRAPTLSVLIEGHSPIELAEQLGNQGILCGTGHFYSYRLLEALGIDPEQGVLRFSMVHYTTDADVDRLIHVMEQLIS
jgi:selenocysteine lyase/cysteine desulfurase